MSEHCEKFNFIHIVEVGIHEFGLFWLLTGNKLNSWHLIDEFLQLYCIFNISRVFEVSSLKGYSGVNFNHRLTHHDIHQEIAIKRPQIMLRTAPNFSNSTKRVPAHSSRLTSASLARSCSYLLWGSLTIRLPGGVSRGGSYSVSQCVRPWIKLTPEYPFKPLKCW